MAKGLWNGSAAIHLGEKLTSDQPKSNRSKHIITKKRWLKEGSSSSFSTEAETAGDTDSSPGLGLGAEVKSALKEITSLLNTVVEQVERMEDELQRQRSTAPSSSTDSTPTTAQPPLAVKVSYFPSTVYYCLCCV